jgi:Tol biopolymer transport system component/DNA-binding winged helix-turn-helix (wHTH) protein
MNLEERSVYEFGEFRLDPRRRLLTGADGERIVLTAKAFDALVNLVEHAGELVSRAELTESLWPSTVVEENNLSQAISVLRRTLGENYIATVARRGYQFIADVQIAVADARDGAGMEPYPQAANEICTSTAAQRVTSQAIDIPRVAPRRAAAAAMLKPAVAIFVASSVLAGVAWWRAQPLDGEPSNPLDGYFFTKLTEFEGAEEHAAISHDGRYVAFLRDRDGAWDAWIGQIGTGDFRKLTDGTMRELRNPAVRTLSFSPDGSRVMVWTKTTDLSDGGVVDAGWAVPVVGGALQPWFTGIAELDWSPDGQSIVYHTAAAGDPLFVARAADRSDAQQIYVAPNGLHCHFPLWSRDGEFIYFVLGIVPNEMDLWRIRPTGGEPERLTFHNTRVLSPTMLDNGTLLYLATADDGSGPWLHAFDVERRVSRRIDTNGQAYTSIAATTDGSRLVGTVVQSTAGLWRVGISDAPVDAAYATRLDIDAPRVLSPRIAPGFVVYRAPRAGIDGIWKLVDGQQIELWNGADGRVLGGATLAPNGRRLAFAVQRRGRAQLYMMNVDGSAVRRLAEDLDVRGVPAWSPDGEWIAIGAIQDAVPRLFKIPVAGGTPVQLGDRYAVDPAWSPTGDFLVFSGADVGTNFSVGAVNANGTSRVLPPLVLSRGSRRLVFIGEDRLVVLKGDLSYKDFWFVDLTTGAQRQLTALGAGPTIGDFDVSPDGAEIVFDRVRDEADIVLIERARFTPADLAPRR